MLIRFGKVHAAIPLIVTPHSLATLAPQGNTGAIQSTLLLRSGLAAERLTKLLEAMAHGRLGAVPAP